MAAVAMQRLQQVCGASGHHTRPNPPGMEHVYSEEFEEQLAEATAAALEQGADPAAVFALVTGTVKNDIDYTPSGVEKALLRGIHPDAIIDAERRRTVLHELLSRVYPPRLTAPAWDPGAATLQELLDKGATPDLQDSVGNTALHLLVVRTAKERYFPDPEPEAALQGMGLDDLYRDDERAAYLETVGTALLRLRWSLDLPNHKGLTVRNLLQRSRVIAEAKRAQFRRAAARLEAYAWGATHPSTKDMQGSFTKQTDYLEGKVDRMLAAIQQLESFPVAAAAAQQ